MSVDLSKIYPPYPFYNRQKDKRGKKKELDFCFNLLCFSILKLNKLFFNESIISRRFPKLISSRTKIPLNEILLNEAAFSFVRSSGPGGQNVNKVASKAVLRWKPEAGNPLPAAVLQRFRSRFPRFMTAEGEIIITSQRTRDQLKNKADCLKKLQALILAVLPEPKRRIPTRPTKGSVRRRLEGKAKNAQKKQDRRKVAA